MNEKDRSTSNQKPSPPPTEPPQRQGNAGEGSDSIIRYLRLWEQRRAKNKSNGPADKPDPRKDN